MDFNTETFANSQLKKFREALSIGDMNVGELHYILRWNGIKPLRYEKRISSNEKSPVYSKYEIKCLLKNTTLMNNSYNEIMRLRKKNSSEKKQDKSIEYPNFNNNPHYRTPEMEKASDELLKQQEVYFDDENDDRLYESLFSKKVFFTEEQINYVKNKINENNNYVNPTKVLLIKKYLDDNFVRASMPIIGDDGYPKNVHIVGMKGADGEIARNMTAKQLFYLLQDKFKGIYGDKIKRDALIKQTMIDWYNKKISNEGLLSKNTY